jgi:hypothetical protein
MNATNYLLPEWDSQGLEGFMCILSTQILEEFLFADIYDACLEADWAASSCVYHGLAFLFLIALLHSHMPVPGGSYCAPGSQ